MTLLAVKAYVAQQAAGIALPANQSFWTELHAYRQRPKREKAGHRCIAVVGRWRRREERMTPPRGPGLKELVYEIDLLLYATHSDEEGGGDAFDVLTENAAKAFRGANPGNPNITDPETGEASYIGYIGETGDAEGLPPETTEEQGRVSFRSIIRLEVREVITA